MASRISATTAEGVAKVKESALGTTGYVYPISPFTVAKLPNTIVDGYGSGVVPFLGG